MELTPTLIIGLALAGLMLIALGLLVAILVRIGRADVRAIGPSLADSRERVERTLREELAGARRESAEDAQRARAEQAGSFARLAEDLLGRLAQTHAAQAGQIGLIADQAGMLLHANEETRRHLLAEIAGQLTAGRAEATDDCAASREWLAQHLEAATGEIRAFAEMGGRDSEALRESLGHAQQNTLQTLVHSLGTLAGNNERQMESLRAAVEARLGQMQQDNAAQLERMRATVDEKLQSTLERRLGESFLVVSERLEQVHRGLGEMQKLAGDVGSLQRVLTNVKTRGGWGEVQLGALLEQMLPAGQFERNVRPRPDSLETVEFAIKLPGDALNQPSLPVWLPIDAKFPVEDFHRLQEAQDRGNAAEIERAGVELEHSARLAAAEISRKYLQPPFTTEFGLMFLPSEGLYAEVLRRPGLVERMQRDFRIVIAGPTTLVALLNSLQMGFRTLAIQQRSGEVWNLLGQVKNEFGKFGDAIEAVRSKLQEAANKVEAVQLRSRAIDRRLRDVESIDPGASPTLPPSGE